MAKRSESTNVAAKYAGRLARASLLPLSALLPLAAAAQSVPGADAQQGMIVIPGNGDSGVGTARGANPGDAGAARMTPAQAARAEAAFENAARNAQIVIPGNGEAATQPTDVNRATLSQYVRPGARIAAPSAAVVATPSAPNAPYRSNASNSSNAADGNADLHPEVAALLAQDGANASTGSAAPTNDQVSPAEPAPTPHPQPAAPRAALLQLQQQAASELGHDKTSADSAAHVAVPAATRLPMAAASSDGPKGPPKRELSLANAPTARSMPSLQTIPAAPNLGAIRPVGSRVQNVTVSTPAKPLDGSDADAKTTVATNTVPNSPGANNDKRATGVQGIAPVIVVAPSNEPPIVHSVTILTGDAALAAPAGNMVTGAVTQAPMTAALPGKQDPALIMKTAADFLRQQAAGLPGRVTVKIPPVAPRGLAACDSLQAFMAPGAPMWGRTTVGVRCMGEKPWTVYMLAHISVEATYYVAGRQINPGDVIQLIDLVPREGDLSVMPRAIVTDPSQAVGALAQNRISAGLPVRSDLIRSPMAIQLGQTVKVVAQGDGFSISTDGNAMNNASPGQQVRVKMSEGQTIVGTATGNGVVQIPM